MRVCCFCICDLYTDQLNADTEHESQIVNYGNYGMITEQYHKNDEEEEEYDDEDGEKDEEEEEEEERQKKTNIYIYTYTYNTDLIGAPQTAPPGWEGGRLLLLLLLVHLLY